MNFESMNEGANKSLVYKYPLDYASLWHENALWSQSTRENIRCKDMIEAEINANYKDNSLDASTAVKNVMKEFTLERVVYVLANTVHHKMWDIRFSVSNKNWANHISVLEHDPHNEYDMSDRYCVDGCNTGLVNLFIDEVLKIEGVRIILWEE